MERQFIVYFLTNKHHSVFYTDITNILERRLAKHVGGHSSFTRKYDIHTLVYYENHKKALEAIAREKQIKKWSRKKKIFLIVLMILAEDLRNGGISHTNCHGGSPTVTHADVKGRLRQLSLGNRILSCPPL